MLDIFKKKATAKDVHNELDAKSDHLVAEAKRILETKSAEEIRLNRVLALRGFGNSESVNAGEKSELAKKISELKFYYPQHNILTEEAIEDVCKKYGLLFAMPRDYKGDIPLHSKREIASFKLRDEDTQVSIVNKAKQDEWDKKNPMPKGFFAGFAWVLTSAVGSLMNTKKISKTFYLENKEQYEKDGWALNREIPMSLHIIAKPSMLKLEGKKVVSKYKLVDEDPVVFCKVGALYIQVAAWGDEAKLPELQTPARN